MTKPKISAIIPCLNEEKTLPLCIEKAQAAFAAMGVAGEVVVGDNGSTDRSVEIAESLGARVAHQPVRGYGAALRAAIEAAAGEYLIMADADDSYDWSNLHPFVEKLEEGYDFVIGNRFRGGIEPGAMPFLHRYLGNPVLSGISRFFYKVEVGDFHCGMRGFTRAAYERMALQTEGMEFATEMVVRAAREGLKICEIPIRLHPDQRDRKPHLRSFQDGWRHLRFIMTYAPNFLYLAPGGIFLLLGVALLLLLAGGPVTVGGFFLGPHFLALGLLLTLVGQNIINMGVVAKVVLVRQSTTQSDRLVMMLENHFSLERGLLAGGACLLAGGIIDSTLLLQWLANRGGMENTVHLAFVGTGLIAMGLNIVFSAFLLGMVLARK
ncbi:MAG: glycosyltransferase family 2 protein [Desulfobulbaceae bacterium]|nr:glycosyltransferase family 2 protein [Desulfobulbaceae bacterium]